MRFEIGPQTLKGEIRGHYEFDTDTVFISGIDMTPKDVIRSLKHFDILVALVKAKPVETGLGVIQQVLTKVN